MWISAAVNVTKERALESWRPGVGTAFSSNKQVFKKYILIIPYILPGVYITHNITASSLVKDMGAGSNHKAS